MKILAKVISGVTSPFIIIPIVAAIITATFYTRVDDFLYWYGIFLIPVLLPLLYVLYGVKQGTITDLHVADREQRKVPFMLAVIGAVIMLFLYWWLDVFVMLQYMAVALLVSGIIFIVITRVWKISIHTATYTSSVLLMTYLLDPRFLWMLLALPIIIWARLQRKRHTLMQALAGVVVAVIILVIFFELTPYRLLF